MLAEPGCHTASAAQDNGGPSASCCGAPVGLGLCGLVGQKSGRWQPHPRVDHPCTCWAPLPSSASTWPPSGLPVPQHPALTRVFRKLVCCWRLTHPGQLVFGTQVREAVDHLVHDGVARQIGSSNLPAGGQATAPPSGRCWPHTRWLWPGLKSGRPTRWEVDRDRFAVRPICHGMALVLGMPAQPSPFT